MFPRFITRLWLPSETIAAEYGEFTEMTPCKEFWFSELEPEEYIANEVLPLTELPIVIVPLFIFDELFPKEINPYDSSP